MRVGGAALAETVVAIVPDDRQTQVGYGCESGCARAHDYARPAEQHS